MNKLPPWMDCAGYRKFWTMLTPHYRNGLRMQPSKLACQRDLLLYAAANLLGLHRDNAYRHALLALRPYAIRGITPQDLQELMSKGPGRLLSHQGVLLRDPEWPAPYCIGSRNTDSEKMVR